MKFDAACNRPHQENGMTTTGLGAPPKTGWAKLVPELLVSDIAASMEFRCDRLGFAVAYQRPEEAFAYLERPEGAQIMLSQRSGKWETALLDHPYGRGVMFQVYVTSIEPVARSLEAGLAASCRAPRGLARGRRPSGGAARNLRFRPRRLSGHGCR
jgi:catechol 2,3-dioxygenase-like lactoylglutathione lyase family enzyme